MTMMTVKEFAEYLHNVSGNFYRDAQFATDFCPAGATSLEEFTADGIKLFNVCSQLDLKPSKTNFYFRHGGKFEISYHGLMQCAYQKNKVKAFYADVVLPNDEFESGYNQNGPFVNHKRIGISSGSMRLPKNKESESTGFHGFAIEDVCGSYATASFQDDPGIVVSTVNQSELVLIRPQKIDSYSPWYRFPGEMCKKVAIKRLLKNILLQSSSSDVVDVLEMDNSLIE